MIITVDATGCACPEPVIRTKKAMKEEHDEIVVLVDNKNACENIKRLAKKNEHTADVIEEDGVYRLLLKR